LAVDQAPDQSVVSGHQLGRPGAGRLHVEQCRAVVAVDRRGERGSVDAIEIVVVAACGECVFDQLVHLAQ
jgi:hypothetical protein